MDTEGLLFDSTVLLLSESQNEPKRDDEMSQVHSLALLAK